MSQSEKSWRPFVVLVGSDCEISSRSLESVLTQSGYSVLRAGTGDQTLELACKANPDAVIVDSHSADSFGLAVCRQLIGSPRFRATTPVILTSADGNSRNERLNAYNAGAWDICSRPLDGTILLLKLQTYIRAKLIADRAYDTSLVDSDTGLYNIGGLTRRGAELRADAHRRRLPISCVVFSASPPGKDGAKWLGHIAHVCRSAARASDIMGRLDHDRFAVIAPATNSTGVKHLVARLESMLRQPDPSVADADITIHFSVGTYTSYDHSESAPTVRAMLDHAARVMGATLPA